MSQLPETRPVGRDPRLNIADLYVFDGVAQTVLVMTLRIPAADQGRLDPFHPSARYEFKVHLDHHEQEDVTYRLAFMPTRSDRQAYIVERLTGFGAGDEGTVGTVIARGMSGVRADTHDGGEVWAGRAVDPFYLDLRQLHDVDSVIQGGTEVDLTRWVRGVAVDSFTTSIVSTIVLTVPVGVDGLTIGRQISTWAAIRRVSDGGGWTQVGRGGLPLVCELLRPLASDDPGAHQQTHPADDPAIYGPHVADLVTSTVERLGTSDRPAAYADTVVERIVPDALRYVVGSPAVFGLARFNGRRLADNASEVVFSLLTNSAVPTGLRAIDILRSQEAFPFVVGSERH